MLETQLGDASSVKSQRCCLGTRETVEVLRCLLQKLLWLPVETGTGSDVGFGMRDVVCLHPRLACPRAVTMVTESVPSWIRQDCEEALVHVNVGGLRKSLCSSTLKKFPDTRLGRLLACDSEEDILQVGLQVWIRLQPLLILLHPAGVR